MGRLIEFDTPVEELDPEQLLNFFEANLSRVLDVEPPQPRRSLTDGARREIFRGLQERYGKADAGRIVKWAVTGAKGRAPNGSYLTVASFVENNSWITDTFRIEAHLHEKKLKGEEDKRKRDQLLKEGFMQLEDL